MTELAKKQETAVAKLPSGDQGFDTPLTGIQIPYIKLCQLTTKETLPGLVPGMFFDTLGQVYGKTVTFNILKAFGQTRVKFNPDYTLDCKSVDMINGTKHGLCSQCPFSTWKEDADDRKKNYCNIAFTYMIVPEGEPMPGLLNLTKTSQKTGRILQTYIAKYKMKNAMLTDDKKVPLFMYKFKLDVTEKITALGKAQVAQVTLAGIEEDAARANYLADLYATFKSYQDTTVIQESIADTDKAESTTF